MDKVFDITRDLAKALMETEEYTLMKAAEDAALNDEDAARQVALLMEKQNVMNDLLSADEKDTERINALRLEMLNIQRDIQSIDAMAALTAARDRFNGLIDQVNQVLQFEITGIPADPDAVSGCTGSCASCPGCH